MEKYVYMYISKGKKSDVIIIFIKDVSVLGMLQYVLNNMGNDTKNHGQKYC